MENFPSTGPKKDLKQAYRTAYLIAGFVKNTLTEEEKDELDKWVAADDENMELFAKMTDEKNIAEAVTWFKNMNVEKDLAETKRRMMHRKPKRFWQYAVAASLLIAISISIYLYMSHTTKEIEKPILQQANDLLPASRHATLTLENGKVIVVNDNGNDTSINEQVKILKQEGEIVYENNLATSAMIYHTLSIPRRGHYKLILPDGTKVWLNSESSIRYPIAFSAKERRVYVTGETFFEVAKDKSKPFRVVADDMTIEAVGTQFNVNAYSNEPYVSATLVEGSVLVSKGMEENLLKPSQQIQERGGEFHIITIDVNEAMAWKNEQFKFINTPLESIMRQVERWYDAEVVYQDQVNLHLNATIERDVPVSKLLHLLEETGQIHFRIEGKKINVMK